MTWRDRARRTIDEEAGEWLRLRGYSTLAGVPEGFRRELVDIVNDQYAFGERAGYPYKAWLREMQEFRVRLGLPAKTRSGKLLPSERKWEYVPRGPMPGQEALALKDDG